MCNRIFAILCTPFRPNIFIKNLLGMYLPIFSSAGYFTGRRSESSRKDASMVLDGSDDTNVCEYNDIVLCMQHFRICCKIDTLAG
jgi:hypothetical protein